MRLIDADKLRDALQNEIDKASPPYNDTVGAIRCGVRLARNILEDTPTIDAEPVRHGRWIYKGVRGRFPVCECSVCGNAENADWAVLGDNVNYCPNCGARMDGE